MIAIIFMIATYGTARMLQGALDTEDTGARVASWAIALLAAFILWYFALGAYQEIRQEAIRSLFSR